MRYGLNHNMNVKLFTGQAFMVDNGAYYNKKKRVVQVYRRGKQR